MRLDTLHPLRKIRQIATHSAAMVTGNVRKMFFVRLHLRTNTCWFPAISPLQGTNSIDLHRQTNAMTLCG